MAQTSRRRVIQQGAAIASGFAVFPLIERPAIAVPTSKFRLSERHQVRLRVSAKKLHDNGKLLIMLLGTFDGDDHFNDDIITWGPFGNQKGVVRPIFLNPGSFEIRADGGFIQYDVSLEGRSVKEKNEKRTDYETLATLSGTIAGKG